jgi:hypothetical protein
MKWISVKEKLPLFIEGKEQIVIVSGIREEEMPENERYVYWAVAHAYGEEKGNKIFSVPGWSKMNVTHWTPLPEPPKDK